MLVLFKCSKFNCGYKGVSLEGTQVWNLILWRQYIFAEQPVFWVPTWCTVFGNLFEADIILVILNKMWTVYNKVLEKKVFPWFHDRSFGHDLPGPWINFKNRFGICQLKRTPGGLLEGSKITGKVKDKYTIPFLSVFSQVLRTSMKWNTLSCLIWVQMSVRIHKCNIMNYTNKHLWSLLGCGILWWVCLLAATIDKNTSASWNTHSE